MRKNYVKPLGNVVALQVDENIALSLGFIDVAYNFTLAYSFKNGQKYIKDTGIKSATDYDGPMPELAIPALDLLGLVDAIKDGIAGRGPEVIGWENCNANPAVKTIF
jgi:hypothetical protein